MTPEEEDIAKIEEELDGARRDLQETLSAVNAKVEREVERVEERVEETFDTFNPVEVLRKNIIGASFVAGLIGFLVGNSKYRRLVAPIALVAIGYSIFTVVTGPSRQGSDTDGGESDHF